MTDNRPINETPVDRREETVVTQEQGYAASERVTRDVAAERRQSTFQITQIIWTLVGILEIALGLRFVLKLIAANPDAGCRLCPRHLWAYAALPGALHRAGGHTHLWRNGPLGDDAHRHGRLCAPGMDRRTGDPDRHRSSQLSHDHALGA